MPIGIICAMNEEIALLEQDIQLEQETVLAGRRFLCGTLYGKEAVLVMSRIGKVAVAVTTTLLAECFHASPILFAGTAGAVSPQLQIGDIVIGDRSVQHDFDANEDSPFQVPLIGVSYFRSDESLTRLAHEAADRYFQEEFTRDVPPEHLKQFGITRPQVVTGTIASGDQFVRDPAKGRWLYEAVENIQCVEMEGAAMAQVCYEFQIPFTILRVISDGANHDTPVVFDEFVRGAARYFTRGCLRALLRRIP